MTDYIIIGVLIVCVFLGVRASVKRFRSKSSCCSGSTYVAKSRKLSSVAQKKTYRVDGMHCQHCVNRVMENIQDIPHTSASVNLKKGTVTVSMEQPVEEALIKAAIEKGGYQFLGAI